MHVQRTEVKCMKANRVLNSHKISPHFNVQHSAWYSDLFAGINNIQDFHGNPPLKGCARILESEKTESQLYHKHFDIYKLTEVS